MAALTDGKYPDLEKWDCPESKALRYQRASHRNLCLQLYEQHEADIRQGSGSPSRRDNSLCTQR
jgi:hypothetical protein